MYIVHYGFSKSKSTMDETLPKYSHNLSRDLTVRLSPLPLSIRVTFSRLLGQSGQKQVYFSDLSSKLSKPYIIVYTHRKRISDFLCSLGVFKQGSRLLALIPRLRLVFEKNINRNNRNVIYYFICVYNQVYYSKYFSGIGGIY